MTRLLQDTAGASTWTTRVHGQVHGRRSRGCTDGTLIAAVAWREVIGHYKAPVEVRRDSEMAEAVAAVARVPK